MITKTNFTYVAVRDKEGYLDRVGDHWEELYNTTVMEQDEFLEELPDIQDCIILCYGRGIYDELVKLHEASKIHIGLRNFNYTKFAALPQVYIGSNKLIFGVEPIFDADNNEVRKSFFYSNAVFKEPLALPQAQCVGLRDGIKILREEFIPDTNSWVGLDFETSGFPEDVGFDVSGFSLSKDDKAYFFDMRLDYDYLSKNINMTNLQDTTEFMNVFKQYLEMNSHNIWAYNCMFEMHVLYRWYKKFFYIQDSYALTTADDKRGTLKYNVQYYLNCPSWDDKLSVEQGYIREITDNYKTFKSFHDDLYIYIEDDDAFIKTWTKKPILKEAFEFYKKDALGELKDSEYKASFFLSMLEEYWDKRPEWFACDPNKLGIYCCYDAFYGMKLGKKLFPAYGDNCYKAFLFNKYIGVELKLSGIKVDIPKAQKLYKYCRNICSNFEIFVDKLYLRYYFNENYPIYQNLNIPEKFQKAAMKSPKCATEKANELAAGVLTDILENNPSISLKWSFDGMPSDILNEYLGEDVSDELIGAISEFTQLSFDEMIKKRKCMLIMGEFIKNCLGIYDIVREFNSIAIPLLRPKFEEARNAARMLWPFKSIRIEDAWILIDTVKSWRSKYGTVLTAENKKGKVTFADTLQKAFDKAVAEGYRVESTVNVNEFNSVFNIPQNVAEAIYDIRDIDDPYYHDKDITSWMSKLVTDGFDGIAKPEISVYKYISRLITFSEIQQIKPNVYFNEDPFVGTKYEGKDELFEDKICNIWSNDQFPEVMGPLFEKEFKAECAVMSLAWDDVKKNFDKPTRVDVLKSFEKYKAQKDYILQGRAGLDVFIEEDPMSGTRTPIPWKLDFLSNKGNNAESLYQYIYDDPKGNLNIDLPTDKYMILAKLGVLIDFAAVARKEMTTYVKPILNGKHKIFFNGVHSGYFANGPTDPRCKPDEIGEYDTYFPTFSMNTLNTKRCTSGFHTFLHNSNAMECLIVEDGRIKSYFDVSQMEPRSVCYISQDPVFMDIYNTGKDAYMELAKITWPEHANDPDFKSKYRKIAKVCMISSIYGQGDKGLALRAGVPAQRVTEMKKAMFGTWKEVAKYREHKLNYLQKTGRCETYLGDRLAADVEKAYTKAVNFVHQGNTAVVANEAFEIAIMNIRSLGVDLSVECIVHDSNTNNFPVKDLFECDLCYRRFFRKYTFEKYGIDFKYDLDISFDSCNNMKYYLDMDTKIGTISGNKEAVDYVFKYLTEPDVTIIEDVVEDQHCDPIGDFIEIPWDRSHYICDYPEFLHPKSRKVKFHVNRHIRGEEFVNEPVGEPSYFNRVKRWNEHLVPGTTDNSEKDQEGRSLGIVDNKNKIYPVDEMDKILQADRA